MPSVEGLAMNQLKKLLSALNASHIGSFEIVSR